MKRKTTTLFLFIAINLLFSSTVKAQTESWLFSDEITTGTSLVWSIETFEYAGEYYADYMIEYFSIGETQFRENDEIKMEIIKDPNTYQGLQLWYNLYLNDMNVTSDYDEIYMGYFGYYFTYVSYYIGGSTFLFPVKFINSTGTYNVFDLLYDEFKEDEGHDEEHYSEVSGGYTYEVDYAWDLSYNLTDDLFTYSNSIHTYEYVKEPEGDYYKVKFDLNVKISMDPNTGILIQNRFWFDYEMKAVYSGITDEDSDEGYVHFQLLSEDAQDYDIDDGDGTVSITFDGVYGIIGLALVATLVIYTKKRK